MPLWPTAIRALRRIDSTKVTWQPHIKIFVKNENKDLRRVRTRRPTLQISDIKLNYVRSSLASDTSAEAASDVVRFSPFRPRTSFKVSPGVFLQANFFAVVSVKTRLSSFLGGGEEV